MATDDEGHVTAGGLGGGGLFAFNDQKLRNEYGYESEQALYVVAREIIKDYYGVFPNENYYNGCSDGGREAMEMAERYPDDFNGIIAGAPEIIAGPLNAENQTSDRAERRPGFDGELRPPVHVSEHLSLRQRICERECPRHDLPDGAVGRARDSSRAADDQLHGRKQLVQPARVPVSRDPEIQRDGRSEFGGQLPCGRLTRRPLHELVRQLPVLPADRWGRTRSRLHPPPMMP